MMETCLRQTIEVNIILIFISYDIVMQLNVWADLESMNKEIKVT